MMKRLHSLLFFIILSLVKEYKVSYAQNTTIDSLKQVLMVVGKDTNRVNVLNQLSEQAGWRLGNNDTAFYFAFQAESLAKTLGFPKGLADSYNNQGNVFKNKGNYPEALNQFIKALQILEKSGNKIASSITHDNIGGVYRKQSNYPLSLQHYNASLAISKEIGYKKGLATSYNNIGNVYYNQGNYPKALDNYSLSLEFWRDIGWNYGIATCLNNLGMVHGDQGDYPMAIEYYLKSLRLWEELGQKKTLASAYNNIGNLYRSLKKYPEALDNHLKSLKLKNQIGDRDGVAMSYNNLGTVYYSQDDFPNALKYYGESLEIRKEIGDAKGESMCLNNIGMIYKRQGNYTEATKCYMESIAIKNRIGDIAGLASAIHNVGLLYTETGNFKEARSYLEKGLTLAKNLNYKEFIRNSYKGLSILSSKTGNFEKALEFYKLSTLYNDSLLNEANNKQIVQMQTIYETEKKDAEISLLNKDNLIKEKEISRQKLVRNALIGGFILTMLLAISVFISLQQNKKKNRIITTQKEQVEKKNDEIMASITYAKKLQTAVLPPDRVVKEYFSQSFLLYLPRDIVSGDFYWMESNNDVNYFAVADCTGHGVPGAMLSVIGMNGLNRALNELNLTQPKDILTSLSEHIQRHFEQSEATVRDGMDICLCALNNRTMKLTYAGANNPVWIARNGEMHILKADRRAIGHDDQNRAFTQQEFQLQKDDTVYLASDGYQDQIGGEQNRKLMTKVFRERLVQLSALPMDEQRQTLLAEHEAWKGSGHQTDDICVMGIRV